MAFTAREVIMVFRGQNYLSGALRRVGRDVGALSQVQLAQQQRALSIRRQQVAQQRVLNAMQVEQLTTGSRHLGMQMRKAGLTRDEVNANLALQRTLQGQTQTMELQRAAGQRQLANMTRLQQIQAIAARRGQRFELHPVVPPGATREMEAELAAAFQAAQATAITKANAPPLKTLPRQLRQLTPEQLSAAYSAALIEEQKLESETGRLAARLQTLGIQEERDVARVNAQGIASQKYAATLRERAERIRVLQARDTTLATTEARLAVQQAELNRQMNALPVQRFTDAAARVEHTGRVLQMFGLIGTAAMGFVAKSAADFGTSMTLAATQSTTATTNSTTQIVKNSKTLQAAVTQLLASGRTAAQPSDLSNALYTIFSGITLRGNQASQLRQGVSILREFNKVYTANYGQVEFNDVVNAGINLINNFRLSASQLPKVFNTMQASVRFGAISMGQFVGSLSQVVPAFRAAHYSFRQMAVDIAFVSRGFPQSLRTGTTGLARLTEMFARPNVIQGIQQQLGLNIAPGGQLLPINQIIQDLIKARPQIFATSSAIGNFFKQFGGTQGTVQARRVLQLYIGQMGLYRTIARQVTNDNNELARSQKALSETPGFKWAAFTNQMRAAVLEMGAGAIPAFKAFGAPIIALVKAFDSLSPRTQRFIGYMAGVSAILLLVVGTLSSVIGMFGRFAGQMRTAIGMAGEGSFLSRILGGRGSFGATLSADTRAAAGLAEELGSVRVAAAGGLGLAGVVGILIMFHKQVGQVVGALGGLQNTLGLISVAFAGLTIIRLVTGFRALGAAIGEVYTIAKLFTAAQLFSGEAGLLASLRTAIAETITLRGALMGIAGLVVTATILIKEDKTATEAIRHVFGDTMQKQINAVTGEPNKRSFWQKFGEWFTRPDLGKVTGFGDFFKSLIDVRHPFGMLQQVSGWSYAMKQATTETGRLSLAYRGWLRILGRTQGSKQLLNIFSEEFKKAGLSAKSSNLSIGEWLATLQRSAFGVKPLRDVNKQLQEIHKNQFLLARQDPNVDMYNRAVQHVQILNQQRAATAGARKELDHMYKVATQNGVVATKAFRDLYQQVLLAEIAFKLDPTARTQRNLVRLKAQLQSLISTMQQSPGTGIAAALTAATQAGVRATRTFIRLFNAVQRATKAAAAAPESIAKQHDLIAAQNALSKYENTLKQTGTAATQTKYTIAGMLQEATSEGIVATAQFARLYKALILAQQAAAAHPGSFGAQKAVIAAQNALQSYVSSVQSSNSQVQTSFQDMLSNVQSMFQNFVSTEQGIFGTLFQGPFLQSPQMQNFVQWGGIPSGRDLSKDLHSQIVQFKQFHRALDNLRRRGAPEALIQQLEALGPSAMKQIQALTRLSGPELRKYFNMFREEQRLVNKAALRDLDRQLSAYKKFGRQAGLAMAAGLRSETPAIERAIRKMILDAFPSLRGGGARQGGTTREHHHHHHHHDHTHIHGNPTNEQMTRGRHESFRKRNRHRRNRFHGDRYGG